MSSSKVHSFRSGGIQFVAEQIGVPENRFKESIVRLLRDRTRLPLRAYLAQVEYSEENGFNVALCAVLGNGDHEELAIDIASTFRHMFGAHEHLDILFLSESQETALRKVCCPFFSSSRFNHPDFYLTSSEGYGLEEIRGCYKERRLMNGNPDGYMLCEIDPPLIGQPYGLGGQDIHRVVIASRHAGCSVFAIDEWPAYVHVARLTGDMSDHKFVIAEHDVESIGWAEVYESAAAAKASVSSR